MRSSLTAMVTGLCLRHWEQWQFSLISLPLGVVLGYNAVVKRWARTHQAPVEREELVIFSDSRCRRTLCHCTAHAQVRPIVWCGLEDALVFCVNPSRYLAEYPSA